MRFITVFVLLTAAVFADYARVLLERAQDFNLANSDEWHRVIHYQPTVFGGFESDIDDQRFFLAHNGKTDPEAELHATISSFFAGEFDGNSSLDTRCIFTARYSYLKSALMIDESRLVPVECAAFDHWFNGVRGERLTLIFPAAYMNNPASMFGHTFLRIDKNDTANPLTGYALNYSADTSSADGDLIYTIKGLLGGYNGYFSVLPYAEKTKEYGDLENRDIWEYELNFTAAEIDKMLLHAWELHYFYRDYYFFRENCSFVLLELLEYAKPDLKLTDQFHLFAAPIDTVRAVVQTPNMLRKAHFRPSMNTQISRLASWADGETTAYALALAYGRAPQNTPLARDDQILAFDLAMTYQQLLYNDDEVETDTYKSRYFSLMTRRAALGRSTAQRAPISDPERPDRAHHISRVALGAGADSTKHGSANFRIRPSYHNLADPLAGYQNGSGVSAFDLWVQQEDDKLFVREFALLEIESYAPRTAFFKPISWKVALGYRDQPPSNARTQTTYFGGGAGLSWGNDRLIGYALADIELSGAKYLRRGYAVNMGGSIGLLATPIAWWRVRLEGKTAWDANDEWEQARRVRLDQSFALTPDVALRLEANHHKRGGDEFNEALLFIDYFF